MICWAHKSHKITSKYMCIKLVLWWSTAKISCISVIMLVTHREISCCEFVAPSTVKGDAPVRSSYVRTPTLHQSTACNSINSVQWLKISLLLKKNEQLLLFVSCFPQICALYSLIFFMYINFLLSKSAEWQCFWNNLRKYPERLVYICLFILGKC